MSRIRSLLAFAILMFICNTLGHGLKAQTYSLPNVNTGCPANCRVIPWKAGSDLWNGGNLPNYTSATCTGLAANGTTDDGPAIQACINKASAGTAVFIPAGTYLVNSTVRLRSNVAVRGAGATSTFLNLGSSGGLDTQNFSFDGGSLDPPVTFSTLPSTYTISGTPQKGDTQVTITSGTVNVGDWIKIFGNDDPSLISDTLFDGSSNYHGDFFGDNSGFYLMQQIVQITAKSGNLLTLSRPLYYTPDTTARTVGGPGGSGTRSEPAGAKYNIIHFGTQKAGFENFKVTATGDVGAGQIVRLQGCLFCWVKGVETQTSGSNSESAHIELDESYGAEIRDNYVHDQRSGAGGAGYGIYMQWVNSDHKIENNIVRHTRHEIIFQGGGSGVAILYNYLDDSYTDDLTYNGSARMNHGAHPYMILWEGNVMSHLASDDCWGTSSHQVAFRNWLWGDFTGDWTVPSPGVDAPTPSGSNPGNGFNAVDLYSGQNYFSFVGNVLGRASGNHATWSGATLRSGNAFGTRSNPVVYGLNADAPGSHGTGTCDDIVMTTAPSSDSTVLLHGNYDYKTKGVAFWDGGSNHTLPPSMYYSTKPGYLSGYAWPLEGPEANPTINANAAETCYLNGPAKGAAFNPATCYTGKVSQAQPAPPTNLSGTVN